MVELHSRLNSVDVTFLVYVPVLSVVRRETEGEVGSVKGNLLVTFVSALKWIIMRVLCVLNYTVYFHVI